jgi:hypothetical protein
MLARSRVITLGLSPSLLPPSLPIFPFDRLHLLIVSLSLSLFIIILPWLSQRKSQNFAEPFRFRRAKLLYNDDDLFPLMAAAEIISNRLKLFPSATQTFLISAISALQYSVSLQEGSFNNFFYLARPKFQITGQCLAKGPPLLWDIS